MDIEASKKREELKRKIEEKIDQYNKATFPASDAPQWDSLQGLEHEIKEIDAATNRDEAKRDSANRRS